MWRNHYPSKLSVSLRLKCLLFRNSKCNFSYEKFTFSNSCCCIPLCGYYKWILERNFHNLNEGVRGNQVSLLNIVVELKCCNHLFLFESTDHGYGRDLGSSDNSKLERIVFSSGKLVIFDKLLVRLHETKYCILIFSQVNSYVSLPTCSKKKDVPWKAFFQSRAMWAM
ncbi:Protein CHROMATIN REMODELING 5, partial [Mucuna pruriens]